MKRALNKVTEKFTKENYLTISFKEKDSKSNPIPHFPIYSLFLTLLHKDLILIVCDYWINEKENIEARFVPQFSHGMIFFSALSWINNLSCRSTFPKLTAPQLDKVSLLLEAALAKKEEASKGVSNEESYLKILGQLLPPDLCYKTVSYLQYTLASEQLEKYPNIQAKYPEKILLFPPWQYAITDHAKKYATSPLFRRQVLSQLKDAVGIFQSAHTEINSGVASYHSWGFYQQAIKYIEEDKSDQKFKWLVIIRSKLVPMEEELTPCEWIVKISTMKVFTRSQASEASLAPTIYTPFEYLVSRHERFNMSQFKQTTEFFINLQTVVDGEGLRKIVVEDVVNKSGTFYFDKNWFSCLDDQHTKLNGNEAFRRLKQIENKLKINIIDIEVVEDKKEFKGVNLTLNGKNYFKLIRHCDKNKHNIMPLYDYINLKENIWDEDLRAKAGALFESVLQNYHHPESMGVSLKQAVSLMQANLKKHPSQSVSDNIAGMFNKHKPSAMTVNGSQSLNTIALD